MRRIPLPWTTLVAKTDVNNKEFIPATGFVSAAEALRIRGTFEERAMSTDFRCTFAYQVADSDGSPGTIYGLGSALTADGFNYGVLTDASANIGPKQLVRFGWLVWYNAGGSPPSFARCGGFVEFDNNV